MKYYVGLVAFMLLLQGVVLFLVGQPFISASGIIKLWEGVVMSAENSQHISDWYTFSHIIHGILFYYVLYYFFPRLSLGARLALATGIEVGWELLENSPIIIDRYRETALALGYSGDSILNSLCDTIAMITGFFMARFAPVALTVLLVVAMEFGVGYVIRDNLTLNVLNLIHPIPIVQEWQSDI